jgi:hypothetical protein
MDTVLFVRQSAYFKPTILATVLPRRSCGQVPVRTGMHRDTGIPALRLRILRPVDPGLRCCLIAVGITARK